MKKLLIVDGNSIINRAFYGIKALANKQGMFTNGIYGFLNILFKNLDDLTPDYIAVTFDLKAPTFRHKKYSQYKAQRKKMPEELAMQMPVLKEILKAMNIKIYEKEGYEADDIIGTVSRICDEKGIECYILTGDKDDLQLASKSTKVLLTVTSMGATGTTAYDEDAVFEKYGVTPKEFIDVKGLMGDSSDNVPGVNGIGEKSAFTYIKEFKSIENLYENLDNPIIKPAAREKLKSGKDMAFLSKDLCTIDRYVPMDFDIDDTIMKDYDNDTLSTIFKNLEFNGFMKRLGVAKNDAGDVFAGYEAKRLNDVSDLGEKLKNIKDKLVYKIYYSGKTLYSFAFADEKTVYYITTDLLNSEDDVVNAVKPSFENENILKISSDVKEDIVYLNKFGIDFEKSYFDTGVAAYIINPTGTNYATDKIFLEYFDTEIMGEEALLGTGKSKKSYDMLIESDFLKFVKEEIAALSMIKEY